MLCPLFYFMFTFGVEYKTKTIKGPILLITSSWNAGFSLVQDTSWIHFRSWMRVTLSLGLREGGSHALLGPSWCCDRWPSRLAAGPSIHPTRLIGIGISRGHIDVANSPNSFPIFQLTFRYLSYLSSFCSSATAHLQKLLFRRWKR